ncbi:MAG: hypothetical protein GYA55_05785 [SAR324 cluster bacterium]|uniref:Uncharacterized protein n=1 Tax=SAR324 cluster bacterium TaxID=2024889 RepID=A0A7X9IJI2_9DELT|nr:hypothetical protein [SAR324 cluster bacterium]
MRRTRGFLLDLAGILLLLLFLCTVSIPVHAQEHFAFLNKDCNDYASSKAFVKTAVLSCLKAHNSRSCERKAQNYFEECRFQGDYETMSEDIRSNLLMLIVLQSAKSLKSPGERKRL